MRVFPTLVETLVFGASKRTDPCQYVGFLHALQFECITIEGHRSKIKIRCLNFPEIIKVLNDITICDTLERTKQITKGLENSKTIHVARLIVERRKFSSNSISILYIFAITRSLGSSWIGSRYSTAHNRLSIHEISRIISNLDYDFFYPFRILTISEWLML